MHVFDDPFCLRVYRYVIQEVCHTLFHYNLNLKFQAWKLSKSLPVLHITGYGTKLKHTSDNNFTCPAFGKLLAWVNCSITLKAFLSLFVLNLCNYKLLQCIMLTMLAFLWIIKVKKCIHSENCYKWKYFERKEMGEMKY